MLWLLYGTEYTGFCMLKAVWGWCLDDYKFKFLLFLYLYWKAKCKITNTNNESACLNRKIEKVFTFFLFWHICKQISWTLCIHCVVNIFFSWFYWWFLILWSSRPFYSPHHHFPHRRMLVHQHLCMNGVRYLTPPPVKSALQHLPGIDLWSRNS